MLRFDLEILGAVMVPLGVLAIFASTSKDVSFRRAVLRWFIPLALVWFAPCWLTARSPAAFDILEGWLRPWKGPTPFSMQGNGLLADVPLQFVPWRDVVTEAWRSGELPLLNRFAGAGSPLWENPSAGVLAPVTILGIAFSSFAWPLFAAVVRLVTALCGMYLFMRSESVSHAGALISAIAWSFGASVVAFALFPQANVVVLLPYLLMAISLVVAREGPRGVALAAIVLALMVFGGHAESVLHCAFVAIPWAGRAILLRSEARVRAAGRCVAFGVLGLALAAPVLVPFALQLPYSERVTRLATETKLAAAPRLTVENLIPFVLPAHYFHSMDVEWDGENFNEAATQYAGLAALALAVTAGVVMPRRMRFWTILVGVFLILAFEWAGVAWLGEWVPGFDKVLHGRIRFEIAFVIAVMAGHGFDVVTERVRGAERTMAIASAAAIVLLLAALGANASFYDAHATLARVVLAGAAAVVSSCVVVVALARSAASAAIVPLALFVDLAASLVDYNAPVAREHYYPDRPSLRALAEGGKGSRVLAVGGALMPNCGAMYRLEQAGVNDPMAFEPFVALLRSAGYDTRFYFNRFRGVPPKVLLDYLGVSRIYLGPDARVEGLADAYRGVDGTVVANPGALPRYFVPSGVGASAAPLDAFKREADARMVWVEGSGGRFVPAPAAVSVGRYGLNGATIDVVAEGPSFVASSEVAMPGWQLQRGETPWPMVRVNGLFAGWQVPRGNSQFVLRYRPLGLAAGNSIALGAIAALLSWTLLERRRASAGRGQTEDPDVARAH